MWPTGKPAPAWRRHRLPGVDRRPRHYRLHHDPADEHLLGVAIDAASLVKTRLISPAAADLLDFTRIMLLGLPRHRFATPS
jgi:hypothetical protein